jgi:hypothetical protein
MWPSLFFGAIYKGKGILHEWIKLIANSRLFYSAWLHSAQSTSSFSGEHQNR